MGCLNCALKKAVVLGTIAVAYFSPQSCMQDLKKLYVVRHGSSHLQVYRCMGALHPSRRGRNKGGMLWKSHFHPPYKVQRHV